VSLSVGCIFPNRMGSPACDAVARLNMMPKSAENTVLVAEYGDTNTVSVVCLSCEPVYTTQTSVASSALSSDCQKRNR